VLDTIIISALPTLAHSRQLVSSFERSFSSSVLAAFSRLEWTLLYTSRRAPFVFVHALRFVGSCLSLNIASRRGLCRLKKSFGKRFDVDVMTSSAEKKAQGPGRKYIIQ
jgi:hypothetical protein